MKAKGKISLLGGEAPTGKFGFYKKNNVDDGWWFSPMSTWHSQFPVTSPHGQLTCLSKSVMSVSNEQKILTKKAQGSCTLFIYVCMKVLEIWVCLIQQSLFGQFGLQCRSHNWKCPERSQWRGSHLIPILGKRLNNNHFLPTAKQAGDPCLFMQ